MVIDVCMLEGQQGAQAGTVWDILVDCVILCHMLLASRYIPAAPIKTQWDIFLNTG